MINLGLRRRSGDSSLGFFARWMPRTWVMVIACAVMFAPIAMVALDGARADRNPFREGRRYRGDFPDPFVRYISGVYYAYGTTTAGVNIPVMRSTDMRAWYAVGDALPTTAKWSGPLYTWAPEMIPLGGRYVLFYTTPSVALGRQCISWATSNSPTGPFVDTTSEPLICPTQFGGAIDPSPFVDTDGQVSLLYKSEPAYPGDQARIWHQRLTDDGTKLVGTPVELLASGANYENRNIEAPSMRIIDGNYVLAYSGSHWDSATYNTGLALCASAMGPCLRTNTKPFLESIDFIKGPGGGSFFEDARGKLQFAYHYWNQGNLGYPDGARRLRITEIAIGRLGLALGRTHSDLAPVSWAWAINPTPKGNGYRVVASTGAVHTGGDAGFEGSGGGISFTQPVVGIATTPSGNGYWLAARDGGVFAFGDAQFHGSTAEQTLKEPVVGIAATPSGNGYWLAARDGGVFAFGDAQFHGSTAQQTLKEPVVGIAATPSGNGYWLLTSGGSVLAFGDATLHGSTQSVHLNEPMVAIAPTSTGNGYWLAARDGGVFAFGDAKFLGSATGATGGVPISSIARHPSNTGYWLLLLNGEVLGFNLPVYTNILE